MGNRFNFRKILDTFYSILDQFPDKRTGDNTRYSMRDIVESHIFILVSHLSENTYGKKTDFADYCL